MLKNHSPMLRLIDANLDRLAEGLRVLEDMARFMLEDPQMTDKLRTMRHELGIKCPSLTSKLLTARDSGKDVGREQRSKGAEEQGSRGARESMIDVITANAKRAQESLRVLEEFVKLQEGPVELKEVDFEQARFTLYEMEKELRLGLTRKDKREKIIGLYVILDTQALAGRSKAEAARQAIEGGARVIQLRDKDSHRKSLVPICQELKRVCAEADVLFIINDYIDLALATDADGVHLGQDELLISLARRILPLDKLIGCSARTVEEALQAEGEGADYIGVGSIYPSPTKPHAEVIGLERLRQIKDAVSLPVVAIGGINDRNVKQVLEAGADSVAVVDSILGASDIKAASEKLKASFKDKAR